MNSLRPTNLEQFKGQKLIKKILDLTMKASIKTNKCLEHILLSGSAGYGKTSLAYIIANEMNVNIKTSNGGCIDKVGDLITLLSSLNENDILFIDEIHRIPSNIEEVLYSVLEDGFLDIIVGKDSDSKNIKINIVPFTLIGATTKISNISKPLRDRFSLNLIYEDYNDDEVSDILIQSAILLNSKLSKDNANLIAKRSRGIPRIANNYLKRCVEYALIYNDNVLSKQCINNTFDLLDIDEIGLTKQDLSYLNIIINSFDCKPVGIEAISATLDEDKEMIQEIIEPYLLKIGFITRTFKGRIINQLGIDYFNKILK